MENIRGNVTSVGTWLPAFANRSVASVDKFPVIFEWLKKADVSDAHVGLFAWAFHYVAIASQCDRHSCIAINSTFGKSMVQQQRNIPGLEL